MKNNENFLNSFLILLSECQFLRIEERWLLVKQTFPELETYIDFPWLNRVRISQEKVNRFKSFIKSTNINQLENNYNARNDYVTFFDEKYPDLLRHIYAPPILLYYKGNLSLLEKTGLAVVGPRQHSTYSKDCLQAFIPELVKENLLIVSGLARGVDSLAHRLTIKYKGATVGVIGNGLDYFYPRENQGLQRYMQSHQLVISEYPPGVGPDKSHFPMRNRIIAGLSKGLLITEARKRSGTLITARIALEEGRDIFAVPGPINHPLSEGCNELISLGATPLRSTEDLFFAWQID